MSVLGTHHIISRFNTKIYKTKIRVHFFRIIVSIKKKKKKVKSNSCMHVTSFTFPPCGFDDDFESRPLSSYLFSRYLRDGKNNALSIFMLSGSIVLSSISV